MSAYDAVIVGAGPNGLTAAVELARRELSVLVLEAEDEPGGGVRSAELTLPGYLHDVCSAVHPLGVASPAFRELRLEEHGLEWIHPPAPLAHPLDDEPAAVLERSAEETARGLGADGHGWLRLVGPFLDGWEALLADLLGPWSWPRRPLATARFGIRAVRSGRGLARSYFGAARGRALFAGSAAHSFLPLERSPGAAFGLVLTLAAHGGGWPLPRGGSRSIARALVSLLESLGGEVQTGRRVKALGELPGARAVLLDLTPRQVVALAGDALPSGYRRRLERYRYGPGAYKVDWALDGPVPWADLACARAGTVHLGGELPEIAASERAVADGRVHERPFVLFAQPSLFDPSRAPEGRHTAWAYCHVPHGFDGDVTDRIEDQVERFAPGFRDRILARSVRGPAELEAHNANLVGGDVNGGLPDWGQIFFRPVASLDPWATPVPDLYLCSASTPPGGGVHGMCGRHAARSALRRSFGIRS